MSDGDHSARAAGIARRTLGYTDTGFSVSQSVPMTARLGRLGWRRVCDDGRRSRPHRRRRRARTRARRAPCTFAPRALLDGRGGPRTERDRSKSAGRRSSRSIARAGAVHPRPRRRDAHARHDRRARAPQLVLPARAASTATRGPAAETTEQIRRVQPTTRDATLMAGFTTVQSLGWAGDKQLNENREAIVDRASSSLGTDQRGRPRMPARRSVRSAPARAAETPDATARARAPRSRRTAPTSSSSSRRAASATAAR